MKRWKYKVILRLAVDVMNDSEMDNYGYDGWELVTVSFTGKHLLYHFKKEKQ